MVGLKVPAAAQAEGAERPPQQQSLLGRLFGDKRRAAATPPPPAMVPADRDLRVGLVIAQTQGPSTIAGLGELRPMVGDLPGFAILGLADGEPGAILGLDALRSCRRVVLVASQRRIYVSY